MLNYHPAPIGQQQCTCGLEPRIRRVERKLLILGGICIALATTLTAVSLKKGPASVSAAESPAVLHLKGLVIEDGQGHARILLGAPFPAVPDRVRQDERATALVFLDEQGRDRFSIGEKIAPQVNGVVPLNYRMVGTAYGLTLYDPAGNERGNLGFLSNGSTISRAVFGLDRLEGDAIGAVVDDKTGYAGIAALYPPLEKGTEATGILLGTQGDKAFLSLQDPRNQPRASLSVESKQLAAFHVFDWTGKPSQNLLHPDDRAFTESK